MINMALIALFWVMVIDIARFMDSIKAGIQRLLDTKREIQFKPFDCSLCMSFWTNIAYLICTGAFEIWLMTLALLIAVMTPVMGDAVWGLREFLARIISYIK